MDWTLIPQIIAIVLIFAFMIFGGVRAKDPYLPSRFTPDAHNDKSIVITGWSEQEIRQIIDDFAEAYDWSGYPPHTIEVQKGEPGAYRLLFPQDIHPEMLAALVNYVAYPNGLDPNGRTICVAATTTVTEGFEEIDAAQWGKKAQIYIPEADRGRDAVYMQTEDGMVFACRLPRCVWNPTGDARLPSRIGEVFDGA